jgi:hypothetical protein
VELQSQIINDISAARDLIAKNRKELLDMLELAYGDQPKWQVVRSYILRSFGKNGLEGILDSMEEKIRAGDISDHISTINKN